MVQRIVLALALILIIALGFLVPSLEFLPVLLVVFLGIRSVYELARMFDRHGVNVNFTIAGSFVILLSAAALMDLMIVSLALLGLSMNAAFIWRMKKKPLIGAWKDVAATSGASIYVGIPIALLIDLYQQGEPGKIWLAYLLTTVWATDTGAYIAGKNLGSIPLFPRLSPGKTMEGGFGGLIGAFLPLAVGALVFPQVFLIPNPWILICLTLFLSVMSQTGDLAESLLKRDAGVKDSGNALGKHGGALDRLDSILFVVAIFTLLLRWIDPSVYAA
ncbi:MAG: phosphatidate cytidylyltransferase [Sumerlaeia bacterium]